MELDLGLWQRPGVCEIHVDGQQWDDVTRVVIDLDVENSTPVLTFYRLTEAGPDKDTWDYERLVQTYQLVLPWNEPIHIKGELAVSGKNTPALEFDIEEEVENATN